MIPADGFRRIAAAPKGSGPVLLRAVFWSPGGSLDNTPARALRTYPQTVLYGGPTTYQAATTPQARALLVALDAWAWNGARTYLAKEWILVAPGGFPVGEPPLPHTGWRWWYARETEPVQRYELRQADPVTFVWVPAAGEPWFQA